MTRLLFTSRPSGPRTRRYLAASAVSLAVVALATGCAAGDDADPVSLSIHAVIATYAPPIGNADLTAEQGLATIEVEATESAIATMEWFIAGDCTNPAPATEEFAAACDDSGMVYLLEPAALTGADVESAEAPAEGGLYVTFTDAGTAALADLTALAAASEPPASTIAIVLDGVVFSAPEVQEEIATGSVHIASSDVERDWAALAAALNAASAG